MRAETAMTKPPGWRSFLSVAYFNFSLFCVLLVGLEVAGQVVFYLWKGYPVSASADHPEGPRSWHQQLLEQHPYLVGRLRSNVKAEREGKVASTTAMHTRWTGGNTEDPTAIRIATLGGSTTFGAGLSDAETWPARLQALLGPRYSVINYGLLGYSTAEGVIQMGLLVPESRPDIVILYEGWNDIRNYHTPELGPDYFRHGMNQFTTLEIQHPRETAFERLANVSALCRLALVLAKRNGPTQAVSSPEPVEADPDSLVDRLYYRNLRTMRVLAQQAGAYALLVPQVLNDYWYRTHRGGDWWTPRIDNRAMPDLMRRFNHLMETVCAARDPDCSVFDQINSVRWSMPDFLDEGHFSAKGSDVFARLVAARIQAIVAAHPGLSGRASPTPTTAGTR